MSDVIEITELADQLHDYMRFRAYCEVTWYRLSPEYFAEALKRYRGSTSFFGVDVAPDQNGEQRIIRDRLNPDVFTAWHIYDLREGLAALAEAETGDLQQYIAGRLFYLFGDLLDNNRCIPDQLTEDAVASVEAFGEMRGHKLDQEADNYGSNIWALRVIGQSFFAPPDVSLGVLKNERH